MDAKERLLRAEMTNEEILKMAVQKANENGFPIKAESLNWGFFRSRIERQSVFIRGLIFDHSFAKALWGEKEEWIDGMKLPNYLCELAFMAMQEEPLKYIEEFLNEALSKK
jgi:hypothetical protein